MKRTFNKLDAFAHRVTLNIDGKEKVPSSFGALTSLILVSFRVFYAAFLRVQMHLHNDVMTNQLLKIDYLDERYNFSFE